MVLDLLGCHDSSAKRTGGKPRGGSGGGVGVEGGLVEADISNLQQFSR